MKKLSIYLVLLIAALGAGIFISFLALRSVNTPVTRTDSLPGFDSDPDATPRPPSTPRTTILPTPSATPTPRPTPSANTILYDVPFTPQAPNGEWETPKLADGCEEASVYMAMSWVRGTSISPASARQEILAISDYEEQNYGVWRDASTKDTFDRIVKGYYNYHNAELRYDISVNDIINEIKGGNLVIVPVDGTKLGNPYYTQPGPPRHKLVITGYDPDNREFVTNDPGTRLGESYRYAEHVLFNAVHDYLTGDGLPLPPRRTAMIIIRK